MALELWRYGIIGLVILILIIVFIYIIYKISKSDGEFINLKKNGFFFDPDTGAVGSFIGIEGGNKELVDVVFAPLNNPLSKERIRNVPRSMIPKITYSSESKIKGVQSDGYVILGTGAHGKRRLFDELNQDWNDKIPGLLNQVRTSKSQLSVSNKENDRLALGIDNAISNINNRKDDEIKKKKTDYMDDSLDDI